MKKSLLIIFLLIVGMPKVTFAQDLINTYPSDPGLFVQGFEINDKGQLLVGTGMYGDSRLGVLDYKTGKFDEKHRLDGEFFGEGIAITPFGIWQLTWKEGKAFLHHESSYEVIKTVEYEGEGWGLAYDPEAAILWMSDGSNCLTQRDPESFEQLGELKVKDILGNDLNNLNELEFANGSIYANIWQSDTIVKINPATGIVDQVYILSEIINKAEINKIDREGMDVLNGIAHIEDNRFLITGKYYPVIFEVNLD